MRAYKKITGLIITFIVMKTSSGQDPNFSQFFSSPLNLNPAMTANINSKWRVISNFRDQWLLVGEPYATGTISYDTKVMKNKISDNHTFGLGGMLMYDYVMGGALKSNYASLDASYMITLAEGEERKHRLGAGAGLIYGSRKVDYDKLNFEEQFTGYGFDITLPSGEAAQSNLTAYVSASAGMVYNYSSANMNIDLGASVFHFNKPRQTVLEDPHQILAKRYVVHGNMETFIGDRLVLNTNAVYQTQSTARYYSIGGALGYDVATSGKPTILNGGVWYWSKNAIIPYIGILYKDLQFGISYDITVSKLLDTPKRPKTFELSLIFRGDEKPDGIIHCPWK